MPASPDPNTLEQRLADVEQQVRALRATNLTDLASVVDASGHAVPLSALAFGQVIGVNAVVGAVSLTSVASAATSLATYADPTQWTYVDPTVDVLVSGGRLRTDWAAVLAIAQPSAGTPSARLMMSYSLTYLGPAASQGSASVLTAGPDYYRALQLRDQTNSSQVGSFGAFYLHTGLTPGWYRLRAAFILGYNSVTGTVAASADYPRIAATPL